MIRITIYKLLAVILLIGVGAVQELHAQTVEGRSGNWRSVVQHDADASGAKELRVDHIVGNVTVKGAQTSRITIIERLSLTSDSENQARTAASSSKLVVLRTGNTIELSSSDKTYPVRGASYEITVPFALRIYVDISSGNVLVSGVQNVIHLETGSGNLDVKNVVGPVEMRSGAGNVNGDTIQKETVLNTGAGNVTVRATKSTLTVTSGGGNVSIEEATGNVSLTTAGGNVNINKIGGDARLFTSGGDISAQDVRGSLSASTSGGEIDMSNMSGSVDVSTSGGSIKGRNFAGWINAETNAGDVRLTGVRNGFNLISEVGNVHVELEDSKFLATGNASIDGRYGNVTLVVPRNMNGLISAMVFESGSVEFKNPGSAVETIRERPSSKGESLRRAEYKLGSGGGRIALSTRSGRIDLSIRKND
ncbi:MAG: hypothetical protein O3B41_06125 [Bacteroidetes bacterium]|nr:hypothetical protein [Bacteroidota bacterium]